MKMKKSWKFWKAWRKSRSKTWQNVSVENIYMLIFFKMYIKVCTAANLTMFSGIILIDTGMNFFLMNLEQVIESLKI